MPRGLPLELLLVPLHITQRGVNRGVVFVDDDDRHSWLRAGVRDEEIAATRLHLKQGRAWGDERFQSMVEKTLGHVAHTRPSGRPPRARVAGD